MSLIEAQPAFPRLLNYHDGITLTATSITSSTTRLRWVEGEQAIQALLPELRRCSADWRQEAVVSQLSYALSVPTVPRRRPILLLFYPAKARDSLQILGAVLVFAYGGWLFGQRLLTNADRLGNLGVFGPSQDRMHLASLAADAMLENGAALVRLDFVLNEEFSETATGFLRKQAQVNFSRLPAAKLIPRLSVRIQARPRPFDLPLLRDFDSTLASLGRRTRRNIRAARRKCESELECRFDRHANVSLLEFLQFNKHCWHRVSTRVARWRYATASATPGFLSGLRTAGGEWVCLTGGRLVDDIVIIDWQMNAPSFVSYSVSLTMRGYLMEAFGHEGRQRMYFEGGTSHIMAEHFTKHTVYQIEVRRPSLWLRLLEQCMTRWFPQRAITRSLFGARARHRQQ